MPQAPLACSQHNHALCITEALAAASQVCAARGARLTPQRLQILELIWQSHKPLGAYALMNDLAQAATRRVAPPTVYRALEFLLAQGLIHRIHALNAYIGCPAPKQLHQSHFLLCHHCGIAIEMVQPHLTQQIHQSAQMVGFQVDSHALEVMGLCAQCQNQGLIHE